MSVADLTVPDAPLVFVNPAFELLTGYSAAQVFGRNCRLLQGPGTTPAARRRLRQAIENRRPTRARIMNYRANGTAFWNEVSLVPLRASSGDVPYFFGLQRNVTTEVERERALVAANRDQLTGLATRRGLSGALADAVRSAGDASDSLAVVFVDLDSFKKINDRYGHQAGDETLIAVARRLQEAVRPDDLVTRYGGDEFVIVIQRLERGDARTVAERLCGDLAQVLAQPIPAGTGTVTASLGLAVYPGDGRTGDELINKADQRMYRQKRGREAT